jgi:hypothetical protein
LFQLFENPHPWPTNNGGGFVLQAKSTLDTPTWTNVGSAVTISNDVYTTVVPASNTATFYRQKPETAVYPIAFHRDQGTHDGQCQSSL